MALTAGEPSISTGENDEQPGEVRGSAASTLAERADGPEGIYEYLPPLRGQSFVGDGRFVYLYGPADGSGPMTAEAGTYRLAGDTVVNTVRYHTDAAQIGRTYRWTYQSGAGNTVSYAAPMPHR